MTNLNIGEVTKIKDNYGFISSKSNQDDIFYHNSNIEKGLKLRVGMTVSYEIVISPKTKKPNAVNIKRFKADAVNIFSSLEALVEHIDQNKVKHQDLSLENKIQIISLLGSSIGSLQNKISSIFDLIFNIADSFNLDVQKLEDFEKNFSQIANFIDSTSADNKLSIITSAFKPCTNDSFRPFLETKSVLSLSIIKNLHIVIDEKWHTKSLKDTFEKITAYLNNSSISLFHENIKKLAIFCSDAQKVNAHGIEFIYHMTSIDNLKNLINSGTLLSHNLVRKKGLISKDISNPNVQSRRNHLHDFVVFYFNPRNAMLYVQENHDDIVILAFNPLLMLNKNIFFTNQNAATNGVKFYKSLDDLDKLNWDLIFAESWNSIDENEKNIRKQVMQAEVLIPNSVDLSSLVYIFVSSDLKKKKAIEIISEVKKEIYAQVQVNMSLYFENKINTLGIGRGGRWA
jgi:cold shock CspA family protein